MNRLYFTAIAPIAVGALILLLTNPFQSVAPQVTKFIPEDRPALDPSITYDDILPATNYTARRYADVGLQYPPVAVANKCLFYFSHVRNETAWVYGQYVADWIALRGETVGDTIAHNYTFDWRPYNLTAGWKSALGQAHSAECFIEAYERTGEGKYMDLARKSLLFLKVPVSQGGVMIDEGDNKWWYEEYPMQGGSYVLNGHQFVLLALAKYLDIDNNEDIRELFDNGLNALKASALRYDNGTNNSFYDRLGGPANQYHRTHIVNFEKLYNITKDEEWLAIKQTFET